MDIVIVEDNPETLGVLRDFFRAIDTSARIQTLVNGNALLDGNAPVQADLLVVGYDLGNAVTGTELVTYLEWSKRLSAKTQVVFISNRIEEARQQAPLRYTLSRFYSKPVSLADIDQIFRFVDLNRSYFSTVFYLIDKQKWKAAHTSLQLCLKGCPDELLEQAALTECMLLLNSQQYVEVVRRCAEYKQWDWTAYVRIMALAALGQHKKCQQLVQKYNPQAPFYSASLAVVEQLNVVRNSFASAQTQSADGHRSLFESEYYAASLALRKDGLRALSYLTNKHKRAPRFSYQRYFFEISIVKNLWIQILRRPGDDACLQLEHQMDFYVEQLQGHCNERDKELVNQLMPKLLAAVHNGELFSQTTKSLKTSLLPQPLDSPFVCVGNYLLDWLKDGKACLTWLYRCLVAVDAQKGSCHAATNLLLVQQAICFTVPQEKRRVSLLNQLGKLLFKAGRTDLAATQFAEGLRMAPAHEELAANLTACMKRFNITTYLERAPIENA